MDSGGGEEGTGAGEAGAHGEVTEKAGLGARHAWFRRQPPSRATLAKLPHLSEAVPSPGKGGLQSPLPREVGRVTEENGVGGVQPAAWLRVRCRLLPVLL